MVHIYCKNSNYYKTANFIDTVLKLNGLQSRLELGSLPPSNVGGRVISVTDGFMTQEIYAYDAAKLDIFNPEVSEERAEAGCRFLRSLCRDFIASAKAHGEETVSDKPAFLIDTEHMYCAKLKDISFYAVRPVNASDAADKKVSAKKTAVKENNKKTGTKAAVSTKKKKEKVIQHRYFGVRRAKALYPSYENLPIVLNTPRECDVIASNVFSYLQKNQPNKREPALERVAVADTVIEIKKDAFADISIRDTIVIPNSVKSIGSGAFKLTKNGYVTCSRGSAAYSYCHIHKIANSADRAMGKCQYCGGDFGLFSKVCKKCGRRKDY